MSKIPHDIGDDEIRIISSGNKMCELSQKPKGWRKFIVLVSVIVAIACLAGIIYGIHSSEAEKNNEELELVTDNENDNMKDVQEGITDIPMPDSVAKGYVSITDTIIDKVPLSIFTPVNLTPALHIGNDILNDSTVRFVVQAADIRSDNGGIVGAYVKDGELISKGQAKSGFCAIIGGKMTVGVADATPFLEQALETDGYFFRQYPLVVANQVVENKPKGESLRKALAEFNGQPVVIMSKEKMTFHDFSQSLSDLGVTNAIYLVGGMGYGFAVGQDGSKTEFGRNMNNMHPNTNYIAWR